jgi:hypothetical protein
MLQPLLRKSSLQSARKFKLSTTLVLEGMAVVQPDEGYDSSASVESEYPSIDPEET